MHDLAKYDVEAIVQRILERKKIYQDNLENLSNNEAVFPDDRFGNLLLSCAKELSTLYGEIGYANGRLTKRLAEVLLPESLLLQSPGVIVLHARPKGSEEYVTTEDEFKLGDISFIPVWDSTIGIDGDVSFLVSNNKVLQCSTEMQWTELSIRDALPIEHNVLWIGIDSSEIIDNFKNVNFFFECLDSAKASILQSSLPFTQWFYNGKLIRTECLPKLNLNDNRFFSDTTCSPKLSDILQLHVYDSMFVKLNENNKLNLHSNQSVENLVSPLPLEITKKPLTWLEVRFPSDLLKDVFINTRCYLNCFPAAKVYRYSERFDLRYSDKVFQLKNYNGNFLGIERAVADPDEKAIELSSTNYIVRKSGIVKFDELNAREKMTDVIHSIEKEAQAYLGFEGLNDKISQLQAIVDEMRNEIYPSGKEPNDMPVFVSFPDRKLNCIVELVYYSTDLNKNVPIKQHTRLAGTPSALTMTNIYFPDNPWRDDKINGLKHLISSRGKIVTPADVRSVCSHFFGNEIIHNQIEVSKKAKPSSDINRGLIEFIEVTLKQSHSSAKTHQEWKLAANHLQLYLNTHSSSFIPFEVNIEIA